MDNYLRLALLVLGIAIIGFVIWDGYRKKRLIEEKAQNFNQETLDEMMDTRDGGGFDISGVGLSRIIGNHSEEDFVAQLDEPLVANRDEPLIETDSFEEQSEQATNSDADPDLIITVSLIARSENGFVGEKLLHCMLSRGLRFGSMDIFHRHKNTSGEGPIQFSLANALNPGTFDLDDMGSFQTKAVTLFLMLPGPKEPLKSYKLMLDTAQHLASELDAQLVDASRSILSQQTIQHFSEQIQDFERRALIGLTS